jgi:hypothetical protein
MVVTVMTAALAVSAGWVDAAYVYKHFVPL